MHICWFITRRFVDDNSSCRAVTGVCYGRICWWFDLPCLRGSFLFGHQTGHGLWALFGGVFIFYFINHCCFFGLSYCLSRIRIFIGFIPRHVRTIHMSVMSAGVDGLVKFTIILSNMWRWHILKHIWSYPVSAVSKGTESMTLTLSVLFVRMFRVCTGVFNIIVHIHCAGISSAIIWNDLLSCMCRWPLQ